jgi:hypothetical protein
MMEYSKKMNLSGKLEEDLANLRKVQLTELNKLIKGTGGKGTEGLIQVTNNWDFKIDPKATLTEKDIDALMPKIRDKLCAMAKRGGK